MERGGGRAQKVCPPPSSMQPRTGGAGQQGGSGPVRTAVGNLATPCWDKGRGRGGLSQGGWTGLQALDTREGQGMAGDVGDVWGAYLGSLPCPLILSPPCPLFASSSRRRVASSARGRVPHWTGGGPARVVGRQGP